MLHRLRDGNIVATTSGGASSTMEFTSLTLDDAGYYSCRANNDYGAILSSEAHINVKGNGYDKIRSNRIHLLQS